ncbi:hypothetical protein SynMITS9220_00538 [Synechococcus sp. MIT S9220]|uniref:hypothetical protein n=1 Tax=unclassified Synechococcus TaxID=2626047 RepID=UPI00164BC883|nr:hypothetical protein [Synechococcus sp. MIT S9220]NOL47728.1 hypothetical protein [Synechococcus sp. MIT S9220]QNJ21859.1 hypothetical protein SynMITS9220_00538 [Synechococcus sp. MIT S9220]|tara:strand:+ start:617 stop:1084 length:468 start_codon:yes stop_codon:yes gene_type:complete
MAAAESNALMVQQLSRQLHAVSEIAESLTLRLLAMEERFEQLQLNALSAGSDPAPDEASQQLLDDSGDRLRHLQGLLDEDAPGQVLELVTPSADEMASGCVDEAISDREDLDELEPSLNETVYVDDPQIDPAHDQLNDQHDNDQDDNDQIDLLSA